MPKDLIKLSVSIAICLLAGIVGSLSTIPEIPNWYSSLNKPAFSPPNWIFAPVWTTLYILMGISLYIVWQKRKIPTIFWIQLILNAGWSYIFFGMKNPLFALIELVVLWVCILLTIRAFSKISKTAAYFLYPYLAWVSFASILNLAFVLLN